MSDIKGQTLETKLSVEVTGTTTGKTYKINKFEDIMNIPVDRLDQFFLETKILFELMHRTNNVLKATAEALEIPIPEDSRIVRLADPDGCFEWTDDGKGEVGMKMKMDG